jgi:hypothetical protein
MIGELYYGYNPKDEKTRNEFLNLIKMHDESVSNAPVPLYSLLGENAELSYKKWLSKQKKIRKIQL